MSPQHRAADAAARALALRAARTAPGLVQGNVVRKHGIPAPAPHPAETGEEPRIGPHIGPAPEAAPIMPSPATLAETQRDAAKALLARDASLDLHWAFRDVDTLVGAMGVGQLVTVAGLTGNGKSLYLLSQADAFAVQRVPVLYLPFEVEPEVARLQYAAWALQLDPKFVIRRQWAALPDGARDAVETTLDEQAESPFLQFAPEKSLDLAGLARWTRWGVREFGARVVMIDHLHRMDWGGGPQGPRDYRIAVTTGARQLKDLMRDAGVVGIAAAQITRTGEVADALMPPQLARIKETGGIAEESDAVLMVHRCLRRELPKGWQAALRTGHLTERDVAEPDTMGVTCRKHRLDGDARDRTVRLGVRNSRLYDLPLRDTWTHPGAGMPR